MASREESLQALVQVLEQAMASVPIPPGWPGSPRVTRNDPRPTDMDPGGLLIVPDGNVRATIAEFGGDGPVYECVHTVGVELYAAHPEQAVRIDMRQRMLEAASASIVADPTLCGFVDDAEILEASADDLAQEGSAVAAAALLRLQLITYTTIPFA